MVLVSIVVVGGAAGATWLLVGRDGGSTTPTTIYPWALDELGPAEPAAPVDGRLDLGSLEPVAQGVIGPAGGEVTAADGLRLLVPAGAHDGEVAYTVGRREVLGSNFPAWIVPASPLYVIENGDAVAAQPILVEIPADLPSGGFAMGLFYDEAGGRVEAMPLVGIGEGVVTVAAAHFSSILAVRLPDWGPGRPARATVDTGFRPGVDDWQFVNWGSYLVPGGHCAGQSMSAMWYYIEQRLGGGPALYGRFDNNGAAATPDLWEDDSQAYRLASTVQQDLNDGWFDPVLQSYASLVQARVDDLQYTAFMAAMAITGHPQFVGIWDTQATGAGHAMIVYRGDPSGLQVADPNYPGQLRTIPWDAATATLGPYDSAAFAGGPGIVFDAIGFFGLDGLVNWRAIADRWAEFQGQQAGDGRFPDYELITRVGDTWVPLGPTAAPPTATFSVAALMPGFRWRATLVLPSGRVLGEEGRPVSADLPPGATEVGVLLEGLAPGYDYWSYIDYVDVVVTVGGSSTSAGSTSAPTTAPLQRTELSVHARGAWGEVGYIGRSLPVRVLVFNDGPEEAHDVRVTATEAPDCERAISTLPVGSYEYACLVEVLGHSSSGDHQFEVSGTTGFGPAAGRGMTLHLERSEQPAPDWPASHWILAEFDPATSPGEAGPDFARHAVPVIRRVRRGEASSVDLKITNTFPADYGVHQPGETLVLLVTPAFDADDPPGGLPAGWAIRCTGPRLVDEWQDGHAFLVELNAGESTTLSCTVPGVSELGVTEYRVEVSTWSGYNVSVPSVNWFVHVRP